MFETESFTSVENKRKRKIQWSKIPWLTILLGIILLMNLFLKFEWQYHKGFQDGKFESVMSYHNGYGDALDEMSKAIKRTYDNDSIMELTTVTDSTNCWFGKDTFRVFLTNKNLKHGK